MQKHRNKNSFSSWFRIVIGILASERILIVGHNCLLDLLARTQVRSMKLDSMLLCQDAFFDQACCHFGIKFELNSPIIDFATNAKLQGYINLLLPSWNSGTMINLSSGVESQESGYKRKYPIIIFANIVLVWDFPSKLTPKKLKDCISKVFGSGSLTSIFFFLDSTAALIQFRKEELGNEFLI